MIIPKLCVSAYVRHVSLPLEDARQIITSTLPPDGQTSLLFVTFQTLHLANAMKIHKAAQLLLRQRERTKTVAGVIKRWRPLCHFSIDWAAVDSICIGASAGINRLLHAGKEFVY
jgi:hypothetical protein